MSYGRGWGLSAIPTTGIRVSRGSYLGFDAGGDGTGVGAQPIKGVSWMNRERRDALTRWLDRMKQVIGPEQFQPGVTGLGIATSDLTAAAGSVLGPGGVLIGKTIGGLIKTSAAGPNQDAAAAVWPLAQAGNLAAVQAFNSRAGLQTVTSAAPWRAGANELVKNVDLMNQVNAAIAAGLIPASWWQLKPEDVLPTVQRYAVRYQGGTAATTALQTPTTLLTPQATGPSLVDTAIRSIAAGFFSTPFGTQVGVDTARGAASSALASVSAMLVPLAVVGFGALLLSKTAGGGFRRSRRRRR